MVRFVGKYRNRLDKPQKTVYNMYRGPLNIRRAESDEKIFRQSKQNSARVVDPTRRDFVTISETSSGGKDSDDSLCVEFLEVPYILLCFIRDRLRADSFSAE